LFGNFWKIIMQNLIAGGHESVESRMLCACSSKGNKLTPRNGSKWKYHLSKRSPFKSPPK
jgi:hypothetical protein